MSAVSCEAAEVFTGTRTGKNLMPRPSPFLFWPLLCSGSLLFFADVLAFAALTDQILLG